MHSGHWVMQLQAMTSNRGRFSDYQFIYIPLRGLAIFWLMVIIFSTAGILGYFWNVLNPWGSLGHALHGLKHLNLSNVIFTLTKHYFLLLNNLVFWHEQISKCLSVRKVLVRLESSNRGLCGVGMKQVTIRLQVLEQTDLKAGIAVCHLHLT